MPWLVPLGPPGLARALGSGARTAWRTVGSSSGGSPRAAAAAGAAAPLFGGQVQAGLAGADARAAPRRRQHRSSLLQGHSWLRLGDLRLQNPLRLLPAAGRIAPAAAPRCSYLPALTGSGRVQQAREEAELGQLQLQITLQATASNFPSSSSSSGKDIGGSPGKEATDPSDEDEKKPNKTQQLKKVFKEYGAVGVSFHIGISLMSLGIFYLAVSSGVDMTAVLLKLGFNEALVQSKVAAGTSTIVLAYAIHKVFAPVRISITLVSVPFLVRYFRKIGFFKPPASNP
ncbi:protein FAM210B, mitochondrial [Emydura macquarii macquarii]|uniref:protein FAM210B, mitochondrial n=1 Tax=Emydura macquarii macquarii TaxID=1129001 RepID=UPI00352ACD13